MKNTFLAIASSLFCASVFLVSCSKNNDSGTTDLTIRMTDAPYNAQEVNVDIKEVRVNFRDDSTGFIPLQTKTGIYNLLMLQNGKDTALATGPVETSNLKEIRFVLGSNNSIKINNVVYPLTIPSGEESGLKVKVGRNLNRSIDSLLVDFDANASILQTGTGEYKLKPVIKLK